MRLIEELKRRNVIRMALAYGVSAWVLVQVLEIATDAFEAPAWVLKIVITLLALLAIPVLVFSWAYEMTPDGLRREADLVQGTPRSATGERLNAAVIALLLVAVGLGAWQQFAPQPNTEPDVSAAVAEAIGNAATGEQPAPDLKSIAVLPFENFSGSEDDRYFSDGLADTVLHRLAQLDDLTVIARNSSFVYKGENVDVRKVGSDLGVATVLEGSVQRQGNRLRVIAQLVETQSGTHLWSETFDQTMADVFSIQDEIAASVADALQLELLGEERERLTRTATNDEIAWALYLEARKVSAENPTGNRYEVRELLTQALERDPQFIDAYHGLAGVYDLIAWLTDDPAENRAALANGFQAVDRAIAIDPMHPENLGSLARLQRRTGNTIRATALHERYLAQSPNDTMALMHTGLAYYESMQYENAYARFLKAHRLDPLQTLHFRQLGFTAIEMGDPETAIGWYQDGMDRFPASSFLQNDLEHVLTQRLGAWEDGISVWLEYSWPEETASAWRARGVALRLMQLGRLDDAQTVINVLEQRMNFPDRAAALGEILRVFKQADGFTEPSASAIAGSRILFNADAPLRGVLCTFYRRDACVIEVFGGSAEALTSDFSSRPFLSSRNDLSTAAFYGLAQQRAGDKSLGLELLKAARDRLEAQPAAGGCARDCQTTIMLGELRAATGDVAGALDALEAALPDDGAGFVYTGIIPHTPIVGSPFLDPLRGNPRFVAWVEEIERRRQAMRLTLAPQLDELLALLGIDVDGRTSSENGQ